MSITVFKVGGSLLTNPHLPRWLAGQLAGYERVAVVVGGGEMIDAVRRLDAIHRLDPVPTHWLCVRMLRHTAELLASWIPDAGLIDTAERWQWYLSTRPLGRFVVVPDTFYHAASGDSLPCDWTSTSDSIAGLLAHKLGSKHLVLCKSTPVAADLSLQQATDRGIIDPVLIRWIDSSIRVEWQQGPNAGVMTGNV
ncbi:MAG: hypothetical protein EA381_07410 [Planctomycetaceae bacterium]|nr:MAG: hypothetical protein EA381_07410 [Planctomycetaceae bacterium]